MRRIFFLSVLIGFAQLCFGQSVAVNASGLSPDSSAILDVSASDKGILIPRMKSSERTGIPNPAQGLLVFDTTTNGFWYFANGWQELAGNSGNPSGPAGGDLSGTYPSPTVSGLQNRNIAPAPPQNFHVLKWLDSNSSWQSMRDSLALPYSGEETANGNLFSVTNTANGPGNRTAIHGQLELPSAFTQTIPSALWGDALDGTGVLGTSTNASGVSAKSERAHGVEGYTAATGFAGVHGSTDAPDAIGVFGEVYDRGVAVYGTSTAPDAIGVFGEVGARGIGVLGQAQGSHGISGAFQSILPTHADTTFIATTKGIGQLSLFNVGNVNNTQTGLEIHHKGQGTGLQVRLSNQASSAKAIDVTVGGSGIGVYSKTTLGTAGFFETSYAENVQPALVAQTSANGLAAKFNSTNALNALPSVQVNQSGTGKGIDVNLTNALNAQPGIRVTTDGNRGIEVVSAGLFGITSVATAHGAVGVAGSTGQTANDAVGVKGTTGANVNNGIGVLGQAGVNDPTGIGVKGIAGGAIQGGIGVLGEGKAGNPNAIGVKGISYTHNEDVGAVTGINMTDGVGVYGEALGDDGIGVAGTVGNTGNHSVAGVFKNTYANNNRAVVEVTTNGKGNGILIDHNNLTNTSPVIRVMNSGDGQFLRFENGTGDTKTTISKGGDIATDGSITVREDKGIVRNTSSTQLRMETMTLTIPAGSLSHYDQFNAFIDATITFAEDFSSPPAVYLANTITGGLAGLTVVLEEVTTSKFSFRVYNYTPFDFSFPTTKVQLVAMGPE